MQKVTKTEIRWIIQEIIKAEAVNRNAIMQYPNMSTAEKGLLNLRADNLRGVSDKLEAALATGDKRIAIK